MREHHLSYSETVRKYWDISRGQENNGLSKTGVAAAWIPRHPANMQLIAGTMNPEHLTEICKATDITLTRSEWYDIYLAAGHCLP